ncbi:MAG: glycosyltransferase [Pseudomonadota bacterium]|nr:glycosyltransferase [Pseudomonadota bacterium]
MPRSKGSSGRGKCGYKLIQYMASGKPVIASPVGVNREIVSDGVDGYLAVNIEEWLNALKNLRDWPNLRCSLGKAGRRKVEAHYCLQVTAPRLLSVLQRAAGH